MSLPQDLNMDDLPSQPYASPRLLKWFYCTNRVSSSLFLLPIWAIKYAVKKRPRPSWSLAETLLVDFTRRVSAITDQAGVQHATRDPTEEPRIDDLKETRFSWVPGVSGELLSGALVDDQVKPLERVGTFIWERAEDVREDYAMLNAKDQELAAEDEDAAGGSAFGSRFSLAGGDKGDLVGIYFHGGGYTHFSAHESAQTSMIPRRLMQYDYFSAIHSVEYRLLPDSPFPAALQDGLSVYAHLVREGVPAHKIVLIGDSAGGNIVLAVARFLRDTAQLAPPGGLVLLSP
ncbi:alpha/beta hydrolase fold-domain-containing protein [Rhodotorula diobovata]|uniref:Alpha/beta hydrolase fold-domain-containing protein n=1 Tax=Rhodotorula diobovata TaxID=5288 RepID=A0A5C5FVU1_9BASI|nr:alpha/beta hydrolase fold-domain-containing protein [Rhodotorula diobovata]